MILERKHIKLIGLLLLFCMGACDSEMQDETEMQNTSEEVVLQLNVQHDSVVQTRGTNAPDGEETIESIDFLVFNNSGEIVLHQHPSLEWTGTVYKMTVNIPSTTGQHTLYLIANHPMVEGTINTLQDLENQVCESEAAFISPPYVMATSKISLPSLNATAIRNAMGNNNAFSLKRNVAKFSVEVSAGNFTLNTVQWIGCPTSASVLSGVNYTSPSTKSFSNPATPTNPINLYQIYNIGSDTHRGFHVVVSGVYTAPDGTQREGYYKLRLSTIDASDHKVPLTSIGGNNHYKLNIRTVSGFGANSLENAEANGFTNDMDALTILDYSGTHSYQEHYLHNGYQMGFESSHWVIYNDEKISSFALGYIYRCIRDQSLKDYTTFDPDYPNQNRGRIKVKINGGFVTGTLVCNDTPNRPVEMELYYTDTDNSLSTGYVFTDIIQYGVMQKEIIIERKPSIGQGYTVLPMLNTYYGEVIGDLTWMGIAEQRHEGTILYPQVDSDNDHIFVHVLKNDTGQAREGVVHLFGKNGYYELRIRQNG